MDPTQFTIEGTKKRMETLIKLFSMEDFEEELSSAMERFERGDMVGANKALDLMNLD